jgi:probable HAF family extracellular repeat protein
VVDFCGGYTIFPSAINDEGTIVGAAQTATSADSLAFVYQNGACRTISRGADCISFTGITDNYDVIGLSGNFQSFQYGSATFEVLPPYPGAPRTS